MTFRSALYIGHVVHRRLRPVTHRLRYRVFWMLLDLDEVDAIDAELRLFSKERFNLASFRARDHGDGSDTPLRIQLERRLAVAGFDILGGRIELLAMPCVLGYVFNPLSVYFCRDRYGELAALVYEVSNTFGERHSYLIPAGAAPQCSRKTFHVSPFLEMGLDYDFRVAEPASEISVSIVARDASGPVLSASLAGGRVELSDRALLAATARHPLVTLKTIGAIHWEAMRLWWKGAPFHPKPPPPEGPVTIVRAAAGRKAA